MFEEIQYLTAHLAPAAAETVAVRFGLDASRCERMDLDCFRRYVETARTTILRERFRSWPHVALGKLFQFRRILDIPERNSAVSVRFSNRGSLYYSPGKPYALPELPPQAPALVLRVPPLFQHIIDSYA